MDHIVKHLANLKFYADFRRSKANNFDQYLEWLDQGKPDDFEWFETEGTQVIESFNYIDPLEEMELDRQAEDFLEEIRTDNSIIEGSEEWYRLTTLEIKYLLRKEGFKLILEANLFESLKSLLIDSESIDVDKGEIEPYKGLRRYINITPEGLFDYTCSMQLKESHDFLTVFSKPQNKKIRDNALIDCFPRIFKLCKDYEFFLRLTEQLVNPQADLNFIFYKMRSDKLIYYYCKPEFQEMINRTLDEGYTIYSESKVTNSFKNVYTTTYNIFY